jgi:hypothetical protein
MGLTPLPNGFRELPSGSFQNPTENDDMDMYGCDYVNDVDGYTFPNENTYASVEWLKDDLRDPIAVCFNMTDSERDNMSFMTLYGKCDVIQSRLFEGLSYCDFTETQMT